MTNATNDIKSMSEMKDLLRIENGNKVKRTFSDQEYINRQSKLRAHMAANNIDAVLFTSMHNINYYSDFLYCSFGRPYGLVVTQDKVVSISANIDGGQPWRRTFGDYNVVYTDWRRDNYFRAVQQEIPNKGRVGVEFDHIPVERLEKLKAAMKKSSSSSTAPMCVTSAAQQWPQRCTKALPSTKWRWLARKR